MESTKEMVILALVSSIIKLAIYSKMSMMHVISIKVIELCMLLHKTYYVFSSFFYAIPRKVEN